MSARTVRSVVILAFCGLILTVATAVSAAEVHTAYGAALFQSPVSGTPDGTIRGAAFLDTNRNGVMDAGEQGVGGVYFTVTNGDYSHVFYSEHRTVDEFGNRYATGYFGPVTLASGYWTVRLHVPAGYVATVPVDQTVYLPEDGYVVVNLGIAGGAEAAPQALLPATGLRGSDALFGAAAVLALGFVAAAGLGWAKRRR